MIVQSLWKGHTKITIGGISCFVIIVDMKWKLVRTFVHIVGGNSVAISNDPSERRELLRGLEEVKNYLSEINQKLTEFWKLERQYRQTRSELKADTLKEKGMYGVFYIGLAFTVLLVIICLMSRSIQTIFWVAVAYFLTWRGKTKNKKKSFYAGLILFAFIAVGVFKMLEGPTAIVLYSLALIIAAGVTIGGTYWYNTKARSYNEKAYADNAAIDQRRQKLSEEINLLNNRMQMETSMWFPTDYYTVEAVDCFLSAVRNHEADTVKEMVRVYKEDQHRTKLELNQEKMNEKINQSLMNQQEMVKLQKQSNVLLLGNMVTSLVTASKVGEVANNTYGINSNVQSVSKKMDFLQSTMDKLKNKN